MPHLKNYMEEIVFNQIDLILTDINVCKCQKCKLDIAALALNSLPPQYIVTSKGELYSRLKLLEQQFEVDVITAVTRAAVLVKRDPRHLD